MAKKIPEDAYAIIIGAMKCGTSSLYSYLIEHPYICASITKEPNYFTENVGDRVDVDKYEELWNFDVSTHLYALEASVGYTKFPFEPNVARKIRNYGINPKFIYLIRNPFERIQSHFNYMVQMRKWQGELVSEHLINTSNYFLQLEQYRKFFPRERILLLDFHELASNPRMVLQKVYKFLEISETYYPASYAVKNPTPRFSRVELIIKRSPLGALIGFSKFLPRSVIKSSKLFLRSVSPQSKRLLSDGEKQIVYDRLKKDMIFLQEEYDVDINQWGF